MAEQRTQTADTYIMYECFFFICLVRSMLQPFPGSRLIGWRCRHWPRAVTSFISLFTNAAKKILRFTGNKAHHGKNEPPSHSLGLFIKCNNFNFAVSLKVIWIFFFLLHLFPSSSSSSSHTYRVLTFTFVRFWIFSLLVFAHLCFASDGNGGSDGGGDGGVSVMRAAYTKCRRLALAVASIGVSEMWTEKEKEEKLLLINRIEHSYGFKLNIE